MVSHVKRMPRPRLPPTFAGKPYFRDAFKWRRCLSPANGYYEWRAAGGKQPYFIRMAGADILSFVGLWSAWQGPDGLVESCVIITTSAKEELADIHDRMRAIFCAGRLRRVAGGQGTGPDQALCRGD